MGEDTNGQRRGQTARARTGVGRGRARYFLTVGPDNESLWVRLYLQPVGEQWVALLVAEGAEPPAPGKLKGMGFFAGTPAEAEELALRYVGRCTEQN